MSYFQIIVGLSFLIGPFCTMASDEASSRPFLSQSKGCLQTFREEKGWDGEREYPPEPGSPRLPSFDELQGVQQVVFVHWRSGGRERSRLRAIVTGLNERTLWLRVQDTRSGRLVEGYDSVFYFDPVTRRIRPTTGPHMKWVELIPDSDSSSGKSAPEEDQGV